MQDAEIPKAAIFAESTVGAGMGVLVVVMSEMSMFVQ
jgi:hypothetical protein